MAVKLEKMTGRILKPEKPGRKKEISDVSPEIARKSMCKGL